ncbi:MAG TPA: YraN family protein [Candidatus Methanoperedens sp.]|nr:YraN family protein [Candidatus Methanoperedens sp.]
MHDTAVTGGNRRALGAGGEAVAASHLERLGFRILERNVRCGRGEIDLIALDGRVVVFIEVKSNRGGRFGAPEEMVTPGKQRRLTQLATWYLQRRRWLGRPARFDVVAVDWGPVGSAAVRHFPDAFPASGGW